PATNGGTRRNRGGQGQNGVNAAAAPQQPAPAGGGTHVITEGAKSALAKIAASTIAPVLTDSGVPLEIELPSADSAEQPERPKRRRKRSDGGSSKSEADILLDSVLNALPEPKAPGQGRARRRVTTATLTTTPAVGDQPQG
ncbi:MAG TPA: ribonuclease E/G, partial [Microbacterium ginsengisoli]|nr:ribonuclease E/G [Microbacterium ginsengisoli]